jgi:hypothetical protein
MQFFLEIKPDWDTDKEMEYPVFVLWYKKDEINSISVISYGQMFGCSLKSDCNVTKKSQIRENKVKLFK